MVNLVSMYSIKSFNMKIVMKKTMSYLLLLGNMIMTITSCQKSFDRLFAVSEESVIANNSNSRKEKKKIYVSDLIWLSRWIA